MHTSACYSLHCISFYKVKTTSRRVQIKLYWYATHHLWSFLASGQKNELQQPCTVLFCVFCSFLIEFSQLPLFNHWNKNKNKILSIMAITFLEFWPFRQRCHSPHVTQSQIRTNTKHIQLLWNNLKLRRPGI